MPEPGQNESEQDFISRCIPIVLDDGTAKDQEQAAAICYSIWEKKSITPETMIGFGGSVKALGEGKVAGYLVRFTSDKEPDLTGDYFSARTDFGFEDSATIPVFYQHGMDETIKMRRIGKGTLKLDDVGAWFEAQLNLRDEYEQSIYQLVEAGKLGWSSGAAGHLVEREPVGKSYHIKTWVIAEASLTPTPAEPRNSVIPIKSLFTSSEAVVTDKDADDSNTVIPNEEQTMELTEIQALIDSAVKAAADEAVKKYAEKEPEVKAGYQVEVVEDEADRALKGNPFKTGEFLQAVKRAALQPYDIDKRLLPLKASGLNEAIPSQGGFLVQQDIASGILENMWGVGSVLSRFSPMNVSGNGIILNAIDETNRGDGYRGGGVLGYWLEEAGTKTATKPKFRQIDIKLNKVAAACYATDELLEDATGLQSWITNYVPGELRFKVEQAIINGNGVGKPLGILQAPALVQAVRTDASEIDSLDVARMWQLRYPGVNDYVWFINSNIFVQLLNMTLGDQPIYMPPGGIANAPYGTLLGRPVIETEYNPGLGTLGDILLASPSQYVAIQKGGVKADSSIHVQFLTDETTFRFVYRFGGAPAWYSAVTAYASTDALSPFVALAAST